MDGNEKNSGKWKVRRRGGVRFICAIASVTIFKNFIETLRSG